MSLAIQKVGKFTLLPRNVRLVGPNLLQKVKGRRRRTLTKAQKNRAASTRRQFKIPLLTAAALAPTAFNVINVLKLIQARGFRPDLGVLLADAILRPMTGIKLVPTDLEGGFTASFDGGALLSGLFPLIITGLVRKQGIFRSINMKLATGKIPLRLT